MNFSLSDLVPPLRWSDASTITLLTGQPDLPDAWWRSLPLPRVLAVIGPEALGELLTEIALEQWPAAAVGDVLPALYVLDPEEADEPHVAIALDRAGSWAGLLTLTGRELVDQPFVQARAVLGTLFSAVFARLSPVASGPPVPSAHAVEAPAAFAVAAPSVAPDVAAEPGPVASEQPEAEPAQVEHIEADHAEAEHAGAEHAEVEHAEVERGEPEPAEGEHAEAEHAGPDQAAAEGPEAEHAEDEGEGERAEAERAEAQEADDAEAEHAEGTAGAPAEDARAADAAGARAEDEGADAEHAADAAPEDAAPEDAAPEGADDAGDAHDADAQGEESRAEDTQDDEEIAEPEAAGDGAPAPGEAPAAAAERDLSDLIEAAFAGLDDKSWAVAQNRVFTDEPSAVDQLAKLFAVPPAEIVETEAGLRALVDRWLGSDEAAPFRAHLDELRRTIGPAAPRDELIAAAPWHTKEIKALEVPAWQVVLATLPARPAQGPPAAAGGSAAPPGPPGKAGPSVFHAFTPAAPPAGQSNGGSGEHHPGVAEQPAAEEPPAVEPVPVRHDVPRGGEQQIGKPYQPLKDVSQTRRCFRQPDGRWWLRVDVTAEQLAGGECPLPTGFAAYLGLSPGETRTVRSAAGELTMTWHGRPVMESVERLLVDVGAKEGGHLFLTLSDEGVLRARHLPVAAQGAEKITKALRLVGYTAPGGTRDQAARVIATRIGLTGPVALPELLNRLRERGDRDLLALLD
ncbi:hypothetical protein GCM10010149_29920 [Nonomuraea roseoviolacea subsp. roseoviolacea]|uniref:hypothetical protein n=1 Tax=Nonomuraea roseoviolacea TaxID=103837 RepID=UPI0031D3A668